MFSRLSKLNEERYVKSQNSAKEGSELPLRSVNMVHKFQ